MNQKKHIQVKKLEQSSKSNMIMAVAILPGQACLPDTEIDRTAILNKTSRRTKICLDVIRQT